MSRTQSLQADGSAISPRVGDVAEGEGVGSTGRDLLPCDSAGWRLTRGDPLWPAGHLPLKGGD